MYDLPFSTAAERYLKKFRQKSLKDAYGAAFLAIMVIVLLVGTRENFYEQLRCYMRW